jgi:hypothetical protein
MRGSGIWGLLIALAGAVVGTGAQGGPRSGGHEFQSGEDVCAVERLALGEAEKEDSGGRSLRSVKARARADAACRAALSADCALGRADLADLTVTLGDRHPKVAAVRARVEALCSAAPSKECARVRADVAELRVTKGHRHPATQAAETAAQRACSGTAPRRGAGSSSGSDG